MLLKILTLYYTTLFTLLLYHTLYSTTDKNHYYFSFHHLFFLLSNCSYSYLSIFNLLSFFTIFALNTTNSSKLCIPMLLTTLLCYIGFHLIYIKKNYILFLIHILLLLILLSILNYSFLLFIITFYL